MRNVSDYEWTTARLPSLATYRHRCQEIAAEVQPKVSRWTFFAGATLGLLLGWMVWG